MSNETTRQNATRTDSPSVIPDLPIPSAAFKTTNVVLYATILVLSLGGNSAMLTILGRRSRLQSQSNALLLNMVVAQLCVALTSIPFDIVAIELNGAWVYGGALCKIVYPLQTLPYGALVFSITSMSYYRYRGIVYPLQKNLGRGAVRSVIAMTWFVSLVVVIPFSAYLEYVDGECKETWSASAAASYTIVLFVSQYAIPLCIVGYCYLRIAIKLCAQRHDNESLTANGQRSRRREARSLRAARMVVLFFIVFAVCMFPHHVVWLHLTFGKNASDNVYLLTFAYLFTFTSTFANPLIYFTHNPKFRQEICIRLRCAYGELKGNQASIRSTASPPRETSYL